MSSDLIDEFLKINSSGQRRYWINQIPVGLLCPINEDGGITNISDDNSVIGQVILPNSSYGCRICSLTFSSLQEHQEHYKSLSHLMNLKNNLNKSDESEDNVCDNEEKNNDSDESSSDEEDMQLNPVEGKLPTDVSTLRYYSEGTVRKHYTNYTGTQYVFHPSNSVWEYRISDMIYGFPNSPVDLNSPDCDPCKILSQTLDYFHQKNHLICILILRSGKFAASIFDSSTGKSIIHKVFRRYTVRAKAGGSQSSHDSKGRKAQSIGSQLRRYGEQALREDIYKLLMSWKEFLNNCSAIFMALPKTMRGYIFHNDLPQDRDYPLKTIDSRVKFISFQVKKPIYEELCSVYEKCMMVTFGIFQESETDDFQNANESILAESQPIAALTTIKEMASVAEEELDFHLDESLLRLKDACERGNTEEVKSLLADVATPSSSRESHLNDPVSIETLATLLHLVSERGYVKLVMLLLENGANPEIKDIRNRTPYHVSKDKDTRDAFRKFRGIAEDRWDWDASGVPTAITDELIKLQKEKEKEKKKRAKQRKKEEKQNQILSNMEEVEDRTEETVREEISLLEQRARDAAGVCPSCQQSLYGIPTYDIFDKKCCSSACVVILRRRLAAEAAEARMRK